MAYFINSEKRFNNEVYQALKNHFGDRASVELGPPIKILIESGFEPFIDALSEEEIEAGVCGGGMIQGLNGLTYELPCISFSKTDEAVLEEMEEWARAQPEGLLFEEGKREFTAQDILKECKEGTEWGKRYLADLKGLNNG